MDWEMHIDPMTAYYIIVTLTIGTVVCVFRIFPATGE